MIRLPDRDATAGRKLSVAEAVDFLSRCVSREYQLDAITFWRRLYGDEYADQIRHRVKFSERW